MLKKLLRYIIENRVNPNLNVEIINEGVSSNRWIINSTIDEFFTRNQKRLLINKKLKIIIPTDFNATHYHYSSSSIKEFIDNYVFFSSSENISN